MRIPFIISLSLLLSACGSDSDNSSLSCEIDQIDMAIQTVAPDFGNSSAVALACTKQGGIIDNLLEKTDSDYTLSTGLNGFYHIGRSGIDTVAQYNYETFSLQNWQYSTNRANEEGSSNPYKIIEASNTKAFIIRYNKPDVWVVDPSANTADSFYLSSLDLSSYLGTYEVTEGEATVTKNETSVNVADAVIANGKLFIAMQRLGAQYNYTNESKIAVFDVDSLEEINTDNLTDEKAITLMGHNVQTLHATANSLYVASRGNYGDDYGQLEKIDTNSYALSTVLEGSETIGHISHVQAISDEKLFVLGNTSGYNAQKEYIYQYNLFEVNATTSAIVEDIASFKGTNITDIALNENNNLWVASGEKSKPGVYELDTTTNSKLGFIPTQMIPTTIIFK